MKGFWQKNKRRVLGVLFMLAVVALVSLVTALILFSFGIIYFEDGMKLNIELFKEFRDSWYGWGILILVQVVFTTLLCFVPGFSMAFILMMQALFPSPWQAFAITFSGVIITSLIMYIAGRTGGYKFCAKVLGEKDCNKASELLNHRGTVFFPLMMLFPMFPDDALVMVAGTLRMSLKWFVPSIVIGRGIGVATIIFGTASVLSNSFDHAWQWVLYIGGWALFIVAVFFGAYKFNKFLDKRRIAAEEKKKEEEN